MCSGVGAAHVPSFLGPANHRVVISSSGRGNGFLRDGVGAIEGHVERGDGMEHGVQDVYRACGAASLPSTSLFARLAGGSK